MQGFKPPKTNTITPTLTCVIEIYLVYGRSQLHWIILDYQGCSTWGGGYQEVLSIAAPIRTRAVTTQIPNVRIGRSELEVRGFQYVLHIHAFPQSLLPNPNPSLTLTRTLTLLPDS